MKGIETISTLVIWYTVLFRQYHTDKPLEPLLEKKVGKAIPTFTFHTSVNIRALLSNVHHHYKSMGASLLLFLIKQSLKYTL